MQNCENDKSDHQMRKKYFQFQRNEQSEIVSELHQCFWRGLSEVWEKTKITLCFTHIQEGWQEFSRKLVTSKIYFEAVTFPAPALRASPHSSHNQVLLWDEQACLHNYDQTHYWCKPVSPLSRFYLRYERGLPRGLLVFCVVPNLARSIMIMPMIVMKL